MCPSKINTYTGPINTKNVLRACATLFWPKVAREATKFDETWTIRSEIARGIVSNRSQGPEMDKMRVFSIFSAIEMALQVPVPEIQIWGKRAPRARPVAPGGRPEEGRDTRCTRGGPPGAPEATEMFQKVPKTSHQKERPWRGWVPQAGPQETRGLGQGEKDGGRSPLSPQGPVEGTWGFL